MSSQIRRVLPPLLVVIACLPPSSHAAVIYLEQHRRVESAVGNNTDEFFDRRQQVAPDFAPFSGQVSSHYFDPEDFDEVTSTVTQASRLEPAGAFASGALGVAADGDFGRGSSLFSAVFDVTDSAYDFTLRYAVSTEGYNSTFRRSFHGAVSLQRLGGPGGATPVVAPAEFDLWNPQSEGPDMARDTRSGLLAPGRYALRFDLEMFATSYTDDYRATYDLALELSDTGHAGIPATPTPTARSTPSTWPHSAGTSVPPPTTGLTATSPATASSTGLTSSCFAGISASHSIRKGSFRRTTGRHLWHSKPRFPIRQPARSPCPRRGFSWVPEDAVVVFYRAGRERLSGPNLTFAPGSARFSRSVPAAPRTAPAEATHSAAAAERATATTGGATRTARPLVGSMTRSPRDPRRRAAPPNATAIRFSGIDPGPFGPATPRRGTDHCPPGGGAPTNSTSPASTRDASHPCSRSCCITWSTA